LKYKNTKYLRELIKKYPKILSGRKNFDKNNVRINKTLKLIKKYFKEFNN
tara:strand:+ start:451 stop:600 length:150 start_codon:yes stop_codon:yes gene_type:complete